MGAYFKNVFKEQQALQLNWLGEKNQSEPVSLGTELFRSSKTTLEPRVKAVQGETQNKLL